MHPVFLDRIAATDFALGDVLHDSGAMSPFSISPVMGRKLKGCILSNETYWVRICMLDPGLEDVFLRSLEKGLWNEPIYLGDLSFIVEDIVLGKNDGNPWAGRQSYKDMLSQDCSIKKISLHMVSPVSFKRGDLHYPLPEPGQIFSNLARRWNSFSIYKIPDKPDCLDVSYGYFDVHTEQYSLRKGGTVIGAVGDLTFVFQGDEDSLRYYRTLLNFAFFSGIGVKTTQGMGMCRIIERP